MHNNTVIYTPRYPEVVLDGLVPDDLPLRWRDAPYYRDWTRYVVARDGRCQSCGNRNRLHAHHIEHASYNKHLRFYAGNGVALCRGCHMTFHNDHIGNTKKRCTAHDLSEFLRVRTHFARMFLSTQLQESLP